jgi:rare lipoprotein A (peptidoglycan hydrolase)
VSASGDGITIVSQSSGFLRGQVRFTGKVPAADAGAVVEIERLGHQTGWKWAPTAHAIAAANGTFTVVWRANHIGRFAIRAVITNPGASAAAVSPTVTTTVYRPSLATLFGPGLWGNGTACGEVLKRNTIGVANRTLRCGTPVAIYYHGRTMVVPVIDRGPYANGADWDLTMATAAALGMDGTDTIGAVSLPPAPAWLAPQLNG